MVEATVQGAILLIYPKIPSVLTHHQEHFGASWPRHSHRVLIYVTLCGASPHALPRFITLGENTNSVPVLRRVKVFKKGTQTILISQANNWPLIFDLVCLQGQHVASGCKGDWMTDNPHTNTHKWTHIHIHAKSWTPSFVNTNELSCGN